MTFLNTDHSKVPNQNVENREEKKFKTFIIILFMTLFLIVSYLVLSAFYPKANIESKIEVMEPDIEVVETDLKETLKTEMISISKEDIKSSVLKDVEENNVFKISSSHPDGFYVMVGSFKEYKNAVKLEKMNPTKFTCHIFEPNYKNLNRVGLFISETEYRKAQNALKEIKNMNPESWMLYNTLN